jgi:hypothetical protein
MATKLQPRQENMLGKAIANLQKDDKRLIGKVLEEIEGTDNVKVITNYQRKMDNGGINRGRLLVMIPIGEHADRCEPHFILLRRTERTDTPTSKFERYKMFSHHQRNKPIEKDDYLINDANHSAFKCSMVGEYSVDKETGKIIFERSLSDTQSGIHYDVHTPNAEMEDIIINSHIKQEEDSRNYFRVGELRLSENKSRVKGYQEVITPVYVKHNDFIAKRTGIFGKTRMGKSNFAKVIAANMNGKCGQLIFDTENEYGDKSRQDDVCLADIITDSVVFGFSRNEEGRESILYNFYKHPEVAQVVISNMLRLKGRDRSGYVESFLSIAIPPLEELNECEDIGDFSQRTVLERRIKIFWAILNKAGFDYGDESLLADLNRSHNIGKGILSPGFALDVRIAAYNGQYDRNTLPTINTFAELERELERVFEYYKRLPDLLMQQNPNITPEEIKREQNSIFDKDNETLLEFLFARRGRAGAGYLKSSRKYHDVNGVGPSKVIELLGQKKTCIINFNDQESDIQVQKYYTEMITKEVYNSQRQIFNRRDEDPHNILIYYEEAHTLFPVKDYNNKDGEQTIYTDIAKRGAKHGIGMVYITQSVTDIDEELIKQTENLFVHYMSDEDEAKALSKRNTNFKEHEYDITRAQSVGYGRMLTLSNRFVIPVQADEFDTKKGKELANE